MLSIFELDRAIEDIEMQMSTIERHRYQLCSERSRLKSVAFIKDNRITWADIEVNDIEEKHGRPYFMSLDPFLECLRSQPTRKKWTEWNGGINLTGDLLAGKNPQHLARSEDLPDEESP